MSERQSVVFTIADGWNVINARRWLNKYNLRPIKNVDKSQKGYLRYRLVDPYYFKRFSTIITGHKGIKFDVVIEDAGHDIVQQLKIYERMELYMTKGGIYIIEDIQAIDTFGHLFSSKNFPKKEVTILDRRRINDRYDDVLVIITDKP